MGRKWCCERYCPLQEPMSMSCGGLLRIKLWVCQQQSRVNEYMLDQPIGICVSLTAFNCLTRLRPELSGLSFFIGAIARPSDAGVAFGRRAKSYDWVHLSFFSAVSSTVAVFGFASASASASALLIMALNWLISPAFKWPVSSNKWKRSASKV